MADQTLAESARREASCLLATKGRAGTLYDLRERMNAVGLDKPERRRLEAILVQVQKLSPRPGRADLATRMLYRD